MTAIYSSVGDTVRGVLRSLPSTPPGRLYWVWQYHAIAMLELADADAASWWRELGFPDRNSMFCFQGEELAELEPVSTREQLTTTGPVFRVPSSDGA